MRRSLVALAAAIALVAQSPSTTPVRASAAYILPAPAGTTLFVTQGNNSAFDHVAANGSQYAWDFTEGTTEFPVVASRGGTVIGFRSDSTNTACRDISCWKDANYVLIDHGDGTSALYLHLATGSVTVTQGQKVEQGAPLGRADSTGFSYGTHLHFMVEKTPTARTAAGWWWTQSVPITFADAGDAVEGESYISANQPVAITIPTNAPTARPTPKPTPKPTPRPTPLAPPAAPTNVTRSQTWDDATMSANDIVRWQESASAAVAGFRVYLAGIDLGGDTCVAPGCGSRPPCVQPTFETRTNRVRPMQPFVIVASGGSQVRKVSFSSAITGPFYFCGAWVASFNSVGHSRLVLATVLPPSP